MALQPDQQTGIVAAVPVQETPVRKRRRIVNSCAACRKRKSRCDRGQPCSECVTNATLDLCQYSEQAAIKPRNTPVSPGQTSAMPVRTSASRQLPVQVATNVNPQNAPDQDLASRVSQLEILLKEQMALRNRSETPTSLLQSPPPATILESASTVLESGGLWKAIGKSPGYLRGKNGRKTKFVSGRHWTSLLPLFTELQLLRDRPRDDPVFQTMKHAMDRYRHRIPRLKPVSLPMLVPSLSVDIALRALIPPRSVAKGLVDLYLNTFEKLHRILHVPVFLHQMEYFWKAADSADINWTASLLVVMRLGLLIRPKNGDASSYGSAEWIQRMETQSLQLVELFLHFTAYSARPSLEILQTQCLLVLARMTDGSKPYIQWRAVGTLLQTAKLMGLDHEPSLFPETISLYDAEVRRRIWTTIVELHIHISRTSGLPFPINGTQYNTLRPQNNNDLQITPCAAELPVSEHWQIVTDTSSQHVLSATTAMRAHMEASTVPDAMDTVGVSSDHCLACHMRKALKAVNSPFEFGSGIVPCLGAYALQRVFLNIVAEVSFLHAGLSSFSIPSSHARELIHDSCRAILKLHQDPELDEMNRFIITRWFRNDIVSAFMLLCIGMRVSRGDVRDVLLSWRIEPEHKAASIDLIENTLSLFAHPWQPSWNEVEEQDLLILLLSIAKPHESHEQFSGHLEEDMRKFEPHIPDGHTHEGQNNGSEPQNIFALPSDNPSFDFPSPATDGFLDEGVENVFNFDTFMSEFGVDMNF